MEIRLSSRKYVQRCISNLISKISVVGNTRQPMFRWIETPLEDENWNTRSLKNPIEKNSRGVKLAKKIGDERERSTRVAQEQGEKEEIIEEEHRKIDFYRRTIEFSREGLI